MTVEAERYTGEQRSRHYNTARSYAIRSVEKNTSYIVMIIEARNIIFRIFLWHVLKIAARASFVFRGEQIFCLLLLILFIWSNLSGYKVLVLISLKCCPRLMCEGHLNLEITESRRICWKFIDVLVILWWNAIIGDDGTCTSP